MKNIDNFHIYQHRMRSHLHNTPFAALFVGMSLGKTVTSLTAINDLLNWCEVSKPLVVAPRLVAEKTWTDEIEEWEHLNHLKVSKIIGNKSKRTKAITAEADIWIVSRDNIAWLVDTCGEFWPFDMVVLDESTSFKSHDSLRFRKLKQVVDRGKITRMIQLTGTPVPNGLMDLWAPMYLLDRGKRLGTTFHGFRGRFFDKGEYEFKYRLRPGANETILNSISDICISMKKEDWLELKPVQDVTKTVELPNMKAYKEFEAEAVLELEEGEITAVNAGALYSKLLQFSNGAVYDADKNYHVVHDAKLDMLEEIVEALNGQPIIVFYSFQSDVARIKERIPKAVKLDSTSQIDAWNRGEIEVMIAHPASAGHGLNLQFGGWHIAWFGVPSSLELYQQAVARLDRQGQPQAVVNMHLITKGTLEEEVVQRLIDKTLTQDTLINALRAFKADAKALRAQKALAIEDDWLNS